MFDPLTLMINQPSPTGRDSYYETQATCIRSLKPLEANNYQLEGLSWIEKGL
jgi:hypothetical protein